MGRDKHPGENDPFHGTRSGQKTHSRIVRGQLTAVTDPASGAVQVNTFGVIGSRRVTVPVLWLSANGANSSWGRFMPAGGEDVHVAYRNDDSAVIVGYDATADPQGIGYSTLTKANNDSKAGYASFKQLKPLEFDFKSGGDAYIFGSNTGTLLLAGGQAFIRLQKQDYRIESKAATYLTTSTTSTYRFGTVTRKLLPTDNTESPVNLGSYKEFLVDVNNPLPTGQPGIQSRAKLHMGDVLDNITNIPTLSSFGSPVRLQLSTGDSADILEMSKLEIDSQGNTEWKLSGPISQFKLSTTLGNITLAPGGAGFVNLGSEFAFDFVVLNTAMTAELTKIAATVSVMAAAFNAVGVGIPVLSTGTVPAYVPGVVAATKVKAM